MLKQNGNQQPIHETSGYLVSEETLDRAYTFAVAHGMAEDRDFFEETHQHYANMVKKKPKYRY